MSRVPIQFQLNGSEVAVFADGGANLLKVIRDGVGDTSPKAGCWQGACGACTVLIDGEPHLACLTLAEACSGCSVETAAGLQHGGGQTHPLQEAFMAHFAAQCGFCTPGMLMAAKALLDQNPHPTRDEVVQAISGNICRCTGYTPIIEAILDAASGAGPRTASGSG